MKAEANTANGGIGVSYSNVVLAGGVDPHDRQAQFASNYKANYATSGQNQHLP